MDDVERVARAMAALQMGFADDGMTLPDELWMRDDPWAIAAIAALTAAGWRKDAPRAPTGAVEDAERIAFRLADIHQAASGEFVSSADFYESAVDIIATLTAAGWRKIGPDDVEVALEHKDGNG